MDDKYQVEPRALERAEQAREDLEVTKEQFRGELEAYGPKGPSWDFVAFYEELCKRFLKGRIEEQFGVLDLSILELWQHGSWSEVHHTKVSPRT